MNQPTGSMRRSHSYERRPRRSKNDIEAPLYLCDSAHRVPDSYCVFLCPGYSLEQHQQAIVNTTNLDVAIQHLFPETHLYGTYYCATMDNIALAAVRADRSVEMIECNGYAWLIEPVSSSPYDDPYKDDREYNRPTDSSKEDDCDYCIDPDDL
jgi:hypothetical protein